MYNPSQLKQKVSKKLTVKKNKQRQNNNDEHSEALHKAQTKYFENEEIRAAEKHAWEKEHAQQKFEWEKKYATEKHVKESKILDLKAKILENELTLKKNELHNLQYLD